MQEAVELRCPRVSFLPPRILEQECSISILKLCWLIAVRAKYWVAALLYTDAQEPASIM